MVEVKWGVRLGHSFIGSSLLRKPLCLLNMAQDAVVAQSLGDLQPVKFMFSKKETKKWDFFNKKTNKQTVGSNDWVEVYYEQGGQKLAFVLENVKTTTGVQSTDSFKRGFMSVTLTPEQSAQIRKAVDDPILLLAWQHREDLFRPARKMQQLIEMKHFFHGVVQDGKEKKDKDGNVQRGPDGKIQVWNDSVTGDIPMKKKSQQVVVDENLCQIVDLTDRPYAWTSLGGKVLREVVVEVDKVVFSDKIRVHCTFKSIVPNEVGTGGAKYTTKRRLEASTQESHDGNTAHATAASAAASGEAAAQMAAAASTPAATAAAAPTASPAADQGREAKRSRNA